jgi:hypothetical protein
LATETDQKVERDQRGVTPMGKVVVDWLALFFLPGNAAAIGTAYTRKCSKYKG